jgi:hypothetical protein
LKEYYYFPVVITTMITIASVWYNLEVNEQAKVNKIEKQVKLKARKDFS